MDLTSAGRSRRQALRALGGAAFAGLLARPLNQVLAQSSCAVIGAPSLTEGPYFVDEILHRSDIRTDTSDGSVQPGLPMEITVNLSRVDSCMVTPLVGTCVDIWHCNAAGVYSDVSAQSSTGKTFLRGYQIADRRGVVKFTTIFPGWYQGRAVHIHNKVRFFSQGAETYEFTSQFFFDDALIDEVYRDAPYVSKGLPDTRNSNDGIYGGASTLGPITANSGSYLLRKSAMENGVLKATFDLILDVAAGSTPDANGGGGAGGPGGPGGPGGTPPGGGPPPGGPA